MWMDFVYADLGRIANAELDLCSNLTGHCNQTLRDNEEIFDGYLFFVSVVIGHGVILLITLVLLNITLCNSSQNIHDCAVAGIVQVFFLYFLFFEILNDST